MTVLLKINLNVKRTDFIHSIGVVPRRNSQFSLIIGCIGGVQWDVAIDVYMIESRSIIVSVITPIYIFVGVIGILKLHSGNLERYDALLFSVVAMSKIDHSHYSSGLMESFVFCLPSSFSHLSH